MINTHTHIHTSPLSKAKFTMAIKWPEVRKRVPFYYSRDSLPTSCSVVHRLYPLSGMPLFQPLTSHLVWISLFIDDNSKTRTRHTFPNCLLFVPSFPRILVQQFSDYPRRVTIFFIVVIVNQSLTNRGTRRLPRVRRFDNYEPCISIGINDSN